MRIKVVEQLLAKVGPDSPAVKDAKFRNFGHGAASIRKTARASIQRGPKEERTGVRSRKGTRTRRATHKPAPAGQPVRTQRGAVKRAIQYAADEQGALIGPVGSIMGESMEPHEKGGSYMGATYPQRAVMGPALEENAGRFATDWADSIGE